MHNSTPGHQLWHHPFPSARGARGSKPIANSQHLANDGRLHTLTHHLARPGVDVLGVACGANFAGENDY